MPKSGDDEDDSRLREAMAKSGPSRDARAVAGGDGPGDIFAEQLRGAPWDMLRELREGILGDRGTRLDATAVPPALRALLPYASLLGVHEEGTRAKFARSLTQEERGAFLRVFAAEQLDVVFEFTESLATKEKVAFYCLLDLIEFVEELEAPR